MNGVPLTEEQADLLLACTVSDLYDIAGREHLKASLAA